MAYATPNDVAVRLGRDLTPEETALVSVRLEDVERMIRRAIPDLDAQIAAGTIDVNDVIQVEADAVLRVVRNPDGYISETDGDYTYRLSDNAASGLLGLTDDEWGMLGVNRSQGMCFLTPRFDVGYDGYPSDWNSPTPASAGPQTWKRRRDQEDIRHHYKVIDWVRQRI